MIDGITLGAYALAGRHVEPGAANEVRWYELIAQIGGARGLEVPFSGSLHPLGLAHLAKLLPTGWHIVVTMLPAAVAAASRDLGYGLASTQDGGRDAAMADMRALLGEVRELSQLTGRAVVRAVEVPSAPRATSADSPATDSSSVALARSLSELADWEWGDTALVVEHCDAVRSGQRAEKGYLSLDGESSAIGEVTGDRGENGSGVAVGQSINWGRSAIEGRSSATPIEHVKWLAERGTLSGVFVSGAPKVDGPKGSAWQDMHNSIDTCDPTSLLTNSDVAKFIAAIDDPEFEKLRFLGVKVTNPVDEADPDKRLGPLRDTVGAVRHALSARSQTVGEGDR